MLTQLSRRRVVLSSRGNDKDTTVVSVTERGERGRERESEVASEEATYVDSA